MRQIKLNESQSTQLSLSPFHSLLSSSLQFLFFIFLFLSLHFRCRMDNNAQCGQNELINSNKLTFSNLPRGLYY